MKHCLWLLCCWCVWLQAAPLLLVTGEFTPYTGKALPDGGESTRLVTTLLQEAGYREIQVDYLPWPRGYQLTRNGLVAATFPYAWTAERAKLFHYSAPIHIDRLSWFTYRGSEAIQAGRWQGLRVCIPLGWSTSHADGVIKRFGLDLQRPKTLAQCLQLLDCKRIESAADERDGDPGCQPSAVWRPLPSAGIAPLSSERHLLPDHFTAVPGGRQPA